MTVFYLIRHGKIEAVSGDAPLSQQGLIEAHATAHALGAAPIRHVYTSPLRRAKETAAPIAALHALATTEEKRLRERANWGDLPGQSLAEFVEMWERSTHDPAYVPPIGDSARQAGMRMDQLLRERAERAPDAQMVMVTHGGLITDFLVVALPLEQLERWHPAFLVVQSRLIPQCSITVVRLEEGHYTLEHFAGVKHLLDITPSRESKTSKEQTMEDETRQASKRHLVALMQTGHSWQEAAAQAGVQVSRSTAYRWLQRVRAAGEASLTDGRHGHSAKLRPAVREFLEMTSHESPRRSSREIQARLQERFGVVVSIGHLNRFRATLTRGSSEAFGEKNSTPRLHKSQLSGKREQGGYC